jgi:hypothetical protein
MNIKQLAREISGSLGRPCSIDDLRRACEILQVKLGDNNGQTILEPYQDRAGNTLDPVELIKAVAEVAKNSELSLVDAAQKLFDAEVSRQQTPQTSTNAQPTSSAHTVFDLDAFNLQQLGATSAPAGSALGIIMGDQSNAIALGHKRYALMIHLSTAVALWLLEHGFPRQDLENDLGKYGQEAVATESTKITDLIGSIQVKAIPRRTPIGAIGTPERAIATLGSA